MVSFLFALTLMKGWNFYIAGLLGVVTLVMLAILCRLEQPNKPRTGHYQAPFVPLLPCLGIQCNFALACDLDALTWGYFGIFIALGLAVYFQYGIRHSKLEAENVTRG